MFGMNTYNFTAQHHKASNTLQVLDTQSGELFAKVPFELGLAAAINCALDYAAEKHGESVTERDMAYYNALGDFCIATLKGLGQWP